MNAIGWSAAAIVLMAVFTAWMDPSSGGLAHAAALVLAGGWFSWSMFRKAGMPVHPLIAVPLGCAAWGMIQLALGWTVYPFQTWNAVTAWLARAAVFAVAFAGFQDGRNLARFRLSAVGFGGAYSLLMLLQVCSGGLISQISGHAELAGTFTNRDHYAALMELLLPFALAAALEEHRSPVVPVSCAGLMFASVVACASRAGTAIVCIEAVIFLVAGCLGRRRNRRTAALIGMGLIACTLIGGWNRVRDRFYERDIFAGRREMLAATIGMIRERPLVGFGLGTWPAVYPAFAVFDPPGIYMNHAHNDWAEWTAEGGLPGLVLLGVFACAAALRLRTSLWALGIPAVLAHSLIDFPMQKPAIACAVFLVAGASACRAKASSEPVKVPAEHRSCELLPQ